MGIGLFFDLSGKMLLAKFKISDSETSLKPTDNMGVQPD